MVKKSTLFIHATTLEAFKKAVPDNQEGESPYADSVAFIEGSNQLWAKKHYYSFVPPGGKPGQFLTYESDGKAKWTDIDLAMIHGYGVEWTDGQQDPKCTRIGNPLLHRQLPVQSGYRGCVAKGKEIQYYLDPGDWNHREFDWEVGVTACTQSDKCETCNDPYTQETGTGTETKNTEITDSSPKYLCLTVEGGAEKEIFRNAFVTVSEHCHGKVCDVNVASKQITVKLDTSEAGFAIPTADSGSNPSVKSVFIGSNLSGCDGSVKVHVPRYYGRGWDITENGTTKHRVMISTEKVDASWTEIPDMLVDAYKVSWLGQQVYHRGYLSTLPKDSAVSCMNPEDYMKGDSNSNNTAKLTTDLTKMAHSAYNKAKCDKTRAEMREAVKHAENHVMSLVEYQWIFYWPYVIEYASFNVQDAYNKELDANGYRQGGMGNGLTQATWQQWDAFNSTSPICPNGYTNDIGNGTGTKDMKINFPNNGSNNTQTNWAEKTFVPFRWRGFENTFGDTWTMVDGVIIDGTQSSDTNTKKEGKKPTLYLITNPDDFTDSLEGIQEKADRWYKMPDTEARVKEWYVGDNADMVVKDIQTVSSSDNHDYKSDYYWVVSTNSYPRTLLLGGSLGNWAEAGLSSFGCLWGVSYHGRYVGFRSVACLGPWVPGLKDYWYYIEPEDKK